MSAVAVMKAAPHPQRRNQEKIPNISTTTQMPLKRQAPRSSGDRLRKGDPLFSRSLHNSDCGGQSSETQAEEESISICISPKTQNSQQPSSKNPPQPQDCVICLRAFSKTIQDPNRCPNLDQPIIKIGGKGEIHPPRRAPLSGPNNYDDRRRAVGKVGRISKASNSAVVTPAPVPDNLVAILGHESRDRRRKAREENHSQENQTMLASLQKATRTTTSKKKIKTTQRRAPH